MIYKRIYIFFSLLLIVAIVIINIRYQSPDPSVFSQLNYLKNQIRINEADLEMQKMFPEGYIFMNVLYGLTWCEMALKNKTDSIFCSTAAREAIYALGKLEANKAKKTFDKNCFPAYGMFYQSWTNYLRGKILLCEGTNIHPSVSAAYLRTCEMIASVVKRKKSPFPETYINTSWPADAFPGIASLKIHDKLFPKKYDELVQDWLNKVKERIDPETGLIPHRVNAATGLQTDIVRGSSLSLIIRLLAEIDTIYAKEQYLSFRKLFTDKVVGLTTIREYPQGYDKSGDIDSGPVILGAGSAATIVGIGTAKACGDSKLAASLISTVESTGFPLNLNGEKKYLFGELPVADMFIAWSKATSNYCACKYEYDYNKNIFLVLSILFSSFLILTILLIMRRLNNKRT